MLHSLRIIRFVGWQKDRQIDRKRAATLFIGGREEQQQHERKNPIPEIINRIGIFIFDINESLTWALLFNGQAVCYCRRSLWEGYHNPS